MQTTTLDRRLNNSIVTMTALLILSLAAGVCQAGDNAISDLALLDAADKWQMNRLLAPTDRQRTLEAKGKITIYDGLRDTTVDRALNKYFDRIENMMFTRVVVTDESGKPKLDETGNQVVEDDGC